MPLIPVPGSSRPGVLPPCCLSAHQIVQPLTGQVLLYAVLPAESAPCGALAHKPTGGQTGLKLNQAARKGTRRIIKQNRAYLFNQADLFLLFFIQAGP